MNRRITAEAVFNETYKKLLVVIPELLNIQQHRSSSTIRHKMQLRCQLLKVSPNFLKICLRSYNVDPNRPPIPEHEYVIAVYISRQSAEALEYHTPGSFYAAYSLDGNRVDIMLKRELSDQLHRWLESIIRKGIEIKLNSTKPS